MTALVSALLRAARRLSDRLHHPSHRRGALSLLRAAPPPRSILVVCHGNLCRSPYAASVLQRHLEGLGRHVRVESAGYSHPDRRPPAEAVAAAADRGVELGGHRSQAASPALLDSADLIVVMEPRQALAVNARREMPRRVVILGDLDPTRISTREILDPYGRRREAFDDCYARIDRCVAELVRALFPHT